MPKPRKAVASQTQYCSFCGQHKNDVPLIVTSQIKPESACCSSCAMAMVDQTQQWAYGIFKAMMEEQLRQRAMQDKPSNLIVKDAVGAAIEKARGEIDGRDDA